MPRYFSGIQDTPENNRKIVKFPPYRYNYRNRYTIHSCISLCATSTVATNTNTSFEPSWRRCCYIRNSSGFSIHAYSKYKRCHTDTTTDTLHEKTPLIIPQGFHLRKCALIVLLCLFYHIFPSSQYSFTLAP